MQRTKGKKTLTEEERVENRKKYEGVLFEKILFLKEGLKNIKYVKVCDDNGNVTRLDTKTEYSSKDASCLIFSLESIFRIVELMELGCYDPDSDGIDPEVFNLSHWRVGYLANFEKDTRKLRPISTTDKEHYLRDFRRLIEEERKTDE